MAGEAGAIQLAVNLVRIPDVSFFSLERVPGGKIPEEPIPLLIPDLAVEVISRSNTPKEMAEKLQEYFGKGRTPGLVRAAEDAGSSTSTRRRTSSPG